MIVLTGLHRLNGALMSISAIIEQDLAIHSKQLLCHTSGINQHLRLLFEMSLDPAELSKLDYSDDVEAIQCALIACSLLPVQGAIIAPIIFFSASMDLDMQLSLLSWFIIELTHEQIDTKAILSPIAKEGQRHDQTRLSDETSFVT